jgi:hypothetical protein
VAAFAASEGHAHPRVVELPKTDEGLGFNVMGGKEQNSPIYISRIIPGEINESAVFDSVFYHPVLWRDSISRPIAPVSSVAGGVGITRLLRQGVFT